MTVTTSRLESLLAGIPKPAPEQERAAARACVAAEGYQDTAALRDLLEALGLKDYRAATWRRA